MTDIITIRGFVATSPSSKILPSGVPVTNFRVASTPRWYDTNQQLWREGTTNWYTVNAFRALAQHTARSICVGQPVIVTGRLNVKQWESTNGRRGTNVEIDASAVGHDMNMGISTFSRAIKPDSAQQKDSNLLEQSDSDTGAHSSSISETESPTCTGHMQEIENHANSGDYADDPF